MKKTLLTITTFVSSCFFVYALDPPIPPLTITFSFGSQSNKLVVFIQAVQNILAMLVPIAIGLAVLAFFWFLIVFITKGAQDPAKRGESLKAMAYCLLGIFVMVSVWGIIAFIGSVVGIGQGGSLPGFKLPGER